MGRTKQAGDSNVSMGAAVEEGKARKAKAAARILVVPWDAIKGGVIVPSVMQGIKACGAKDVGVYAVITVRAVQEVVQGTFNRKAAL